MAWPGRAASAVRKPDPASWPAEHGGTRGASRPASYRRRPPDADDRRDGGHAHRAPENVLVPGARVPPSGLWPGLVAPPKTGRGRKI